MREDLGLCVVVPVVVVSHKAKDAKAHHTATAHRVYFVYQTRAPTATEYGLFCLRLHPG